jgi:membrane associated rhomboid family serine protease
VLPLRDENPGRTTPILTWLTIAICVVAYLWWQPSPLKDTVEDRDFYIENAVTPCEVLEGRPLSWRELRATYNLGEQSSCNVGDDNERDPGVPDKNVWLSLVSSMFLHGSLIHIAGNLLVLWVFGNNVEDVFGKVGFLVFYLVGGVVATMAHVFLNPDSTVPLVGASGAIAAVMGAYLVFFPRARVLTMVFMLIITVIRIPAAVMLGIWFALQFITDPNAGVAWAAHVGGFVFGVAIALLVRAAGKAPSPVHLSVR